MDITNILKDKIMLAVEKLENQSVLPKDLKKDSITVEKPKDENFGELSTNVSMVLAKQADIKSRDLAGYLIKILNLLSKLDLLMRYQDIKCLELINCQ